MNTTVGIMFGVLVALADAPAVAQSRLTPKDYDGFYNDVILKAKNGSKAEWLASYDPVINFVARVRQEVEALPTKTRLGLAKAVHDNGYWKGQDIRVRDRADPFIGARFRTPDDALESVLTPQGFQAYRTAMAREPRGIGSPSRPLPIERHSTNSRARPSRVCRRSQGTRTSSMPTHKAGMTSSLTRSITRTPSSDSP